MYFSRTLLFGVHIIVAYGQSNSTLASRGVALNAIGPLRESFETMINGNYHEETNPSGSVNLGIAENGAMVNQITALAQSTKYEVTEETFARLYGSWGNPRLRRAMVNHVNKYLQVHNTFNETEVTFATGVTALLDLVGFSLFNSFDGVLLTRPSFAGFSFLLGLKAGIRPVYVSFNGTDQFIPSSIAYYEAALAVAQAQNRRIRAIVLCNPHNPLGRAYPRETIIALMQFASKHRLHVIVDEVYALSSHQVAEEIDTVPFTSAFSFDSTSYIDPAYLHLLYSMSKDFAASGLKLGALLTKNTELTRAVSNQAQFNWAGNAVQQLGTIILEDDAGKDAFFAASSETAAKNSRAVRTILDQVGIPYDPLANAGFFLWIDLTKSLPEGDGAVAESALGRRFQSFGVFMQGGTGMFAERAGFYRLCFSLREPALKEGMRRFLRTLGQDESIVDDAF